MPKFKLIVSDTKTGKSQTIEIEDTKAQTIIGRKIGDTIDGSLFDMKGEKLEITGGSDKDGFPMRRSVHGGIRLGAILSEGPGFHPASQGERRRKMVRGDTITEVISQINMKVLKISKEEKEEKKEEKQKKEKEEKKEEKQKKEKKERSRKSRSRSKKK